MTLKHNPQRSLFASSDITTFNQAFTADGEVSAEFVFRSNRGPQQLVSLSIFGVTLTPAEDEGDPPVEAISEADDFVVAIDRSLDGGDNFVQFATFEGITSVDVPYPNGAILWRFRLVALGATADAVRVQATA